MGPRVGGGFAKEMSQSDPEPGPRGRIVDRLVYGELVSTSWEGLPHPRPSPGMAPQSHINGNARFDVGVAYRLVSFLDFSFRLWTLPLWAPTG